MRKEQEKVRVIHVFVSWLQTYLKENILWLVQNNFIKIIPNHYFYISIILCQWHTKKEVR